MPTPFIGGTHTFALPHITHATTDDVVVLAVKRGTAFEHPIAITRGHGHADGKRVFIRSSHGLADATPGAASAGRGCTKSVSTAGLGASFVQGDTSGHGRRSRFALRKAEADKIEISQNILEGVPA